MEWQEDMGNSPREPRTVTADDVSYLMSALQRLLDTASRIRGHSTSIAAAKSACVLEIMDVLDMDFECNVGLFNALAGLPPIARDRLYRTLVPSMGAPTQEAGPPPPGEGETL